MKKNILSLSSFFSKNTPSSENLQETLRFSYTTNHKTAALGRNFLYRSLATDKTMEKRKITKTVATAAVKTLDSKITGAQVRDLTQTLIRLRERELARQEKRQTGKHLHDGVIKGLTRSIDLLKNLLQQGYNPGRYSYDESDFSYRRPVRTLTEAQREKNLDNLEIARATKERKANRARLNNE